jgi:hypothetical protein
VQAGELLADALRGGDGGEEAGGLGRSGGQGQAVEVATIESGLLGGGPRLGTRLPQGPSGVGQFRAGAIAAKAARDGLAAHGNHERISARA